MYGHHKSRVPKIIVTITKAEFNHTFHMSMHIATYMTS